VILATDRPADKVYDAGACDLLAFFVGGVLIRWCEAKNEDGRHYNDFDPTLVA
jgi:hypothetical protein